MRERWKRKCVVVGGALAALMVFAAVAPGASQPSVQGTESGNGALQGRVILLDAGHGGTDGGARAKDSGTWEKVINLQVALAVRDALQAEGAAVLMTRETDRQYSENKREDLTARLEIGRSGGAEMVLSIHMNEYHNRLESGPQVFYRAGQEQSRLLAGVLQEALIEGLSPAKRREAMAGDYFILSLDIPSVLVECGFISNGAEEKLLLTEEYQQKIAQAVCLGVTRYAALRP